MASIIKTLTNSASITLEASNRVVVSGANVVVSSAQAIEDTVDVLRDGIRLSKSYSETMLAEAKLDNDLKLNVLQQLAEDEDYKSTVMEAYKAGKIAELKEDLDLE